jgi:hypothetical protein
MTFGAGSGSGPQLGRQGDLGSFNQLQGGSGGNFFPVQHTLGNQGMSPAQGSFNAGSGFPDNGPRRGGQGNGYQRSKNFVPRGGKTTYRAKTTSGQDSARTNANSQTDAGRSKSGNGEGSTSNTSGGSADSIAESKKKAKKDSCYRCGSSGHFFFECTAVLCVYCEQVGHKPDDCHLLAAPKPQLILHGISDEKLMFFECPITKSYRPKLESMRLGLLSVTRGELTIPGIVKQLQRLVPVENFAWECRQVGQNVFKVTFPDKDELERLTRFGTFLVPNSSIKLNFEQCVSSMEPTSKLPEVWILMCGIPKRRIGDFLAMWSLGTLFGKTIKVDMAFTRESGVLRILVGCLDHTRIPAKERIYIADGFYDITFEVENPRDFEMISDATPEDGPPDNDGSGNNGDQNSRDLKQGRDEMDTDISPSLETAGEASKSSVSGPDVNKLASDFSSGVRFSPRVKKMMEQARAELRTLADSFSGASSTGAESPMLEAVPPPAAAAAAEAAATDMLPPADDATAAGIAASASVCASPASPGVADVAAAARTPPRAVFPAVAETTEPACARPPGFAVATAAARTPSPADFCAAAEATGATAVSTFRVPQGSAGELLLSEEKTPHLVHAEEKTDKLSPSQGNYGRRGAEKATPLKDQSQQTDAGSRVAAASFKPSTPASTTRRPIKEVIAFGSINQKLSSPVRLSERVKMQKNGDATQMERAVMMTEQRFYAIALGTKSKLSFSALSNSEIGARANKLGISLGANESKINTSISSLKQCEEDRRITYLQNNLNSCIDENSDSNILATTNSLCSDLALEDKIEPIDNLSDPSLFMPIKCLKKQKKKIDTKMGVAVRRSTRINKTLKTKK